MSRKYTTRPPRGWDDEFEFSAGWVDGERSLSRTIFLPDTDWAETGLIDVDGSPILVRTCNPIGFVHFDDEKE